MGLEMTELIMACEEEFGVDFREYDRALDDVNTVGELHHCIVSILQPGVTGNCPNVPVFLSLRSALVENIPIAKSKVGMNTKLLDLLPASEWVRIWPALRKSVTYELPSPWNRPVHPFALIGVGLFGALVLEVLLLSLLLHVDTWERWHLLVLLAPLLLPLVAAGMAVAYACSPIECHMPAETVRELVGRVVSANHKGLGPEGASWNDASVWNKLRSMISDRFDVDADRITPETDFFKDLGFG